MILSKPMMIAAMSLTLAASLPTSKPFAPTGRVAPATTFNCLLASNVFAQRDADANKKALAHQTLLFYLGRLDPRISPTQLKTELKATADGLKGANAVQLMNDCLHEVQAKGRMLEAAGQQLKQGKVA